MRKHHIEPLEERRMFITYQVDGTSGNDTISISISGNSIISVVNGNSDSASDIINNNIEINGLGGNDSISITETGNNTVVVNAGAGNDTINLGVGANDLDVIDDNVTINGGADFDTITCFDQNDTTVNRDYVFSLGNRMTPTGVPQITYDAELLTIQGGSGDNEFIFNDPPNDNVVVHGNVASATNDAVIINGNASESAIYTPVGTVTGSDVGSVVYEGSTILMRSLEVVAPRDLGDFTIETLNPNDAIVVSQGSAEVFAIDGTSGGVAFVEAQVRGTTRTTIDLAAQDAGAGNDTITMSGAPTNTGLIRISAGTGTNTLTNTGTYTIDTEVGASLGNNLTIVNNAGTLTLDNTQHLKRIELNNSSTLAFFDLSTINVQTLAVVNGSPSIRGTTSNTNSIVSSTSFAIGAGRTLNRTGGGTLIFAGPNAHGANSFFNASGGTTNFNNDLGSTSVRPLSVDATGATINFNTTQHLNLISTGIGGLLKMNSNGSRVLVCNAAFIDSEGSAIDLANNDMVVDYTGATQFPAVFNHVRNGYAGGTWAGIGIISSIGAINAQQNTGLGLMEATEYKSIYGAGATFSGQTIDNTAVVIKYTYYGDADLSGFVDFDDYVRIDSGFNSGLSGWSNGDFDYNNDIDFDDYVALDNSFNTQGAPL